MRALRRNHACVLGRTLLAAVTLLAGIPPASAQFQDIYRTEGATIRLLSEPPNENGAIRAALAIDLEPGWKTYWRDPGESGLAPVLDISASQGVSGLTVDFPAPSRFREGDNVSNGYDQPVVIALSAHADATVPRLVLRATLGLCREICVPVSVDLSRDLGLMPDLADANAIDRAFLSRPAHADAPLDAHFDEDGSHLVIDGAQGSDFFVAGPAGWGFGPARIEDGAWRVPVLASPLTGDDDAFEAVSTRDDAATATRFDLRLRP